jgi:hypothetical protein
MEALMPEEKYEKKEYEIAVRQVNTIIYKVSDFSESLAAHQVQEKIDDRNWDELLKYSPKHPEFKPISPFSFPIISWNIKEDVLISNPFKKSKSS